MAFGSFGHWDRAREKIRARRLRSPVESAMRIPLARSVVTTLAPYGLAIAAVLLAAAVKLMLERVTEEGPFLLLLSAVMISAWYGGLWPGVLATTLAGLISHYFFFGPPQFFWHNSVSQNLRLLFFFLEGFLISWLCALLHRARQRGEARRHE